MKSITSKAIAVPALALMALAATGAAGAASDSSSRSGGPDYTYGDSNPFAEATASVHVVRTGEGGTRVTLHVRDADAAAGTAFGAHVHVNPCGRLLGSDAGPHYQHAGASGSLEEREVWLDFTVNRAGNGHAAASRSWSLDESTPRSVIIHAMPTEPTTGGAGARLACIDLDGQP